MIEFFLLLVFTMILLFFFRRLELPKLAIRPYFFREHRLNDYKGFFITFLILSSFSALRDGIGNDYNSYMMHIKMIQNNQPNYMEEGFKAIVHNLERIDNNPRLVIIVCAFITVFFYLLSIWNLSSNIEMSVLIFITWGYYFLTFQSIRNYLALAICIYSIKFLNNNNILLFIALVLLAATIHKSALICIPFYLLMKWLSTKNIHFKNLLVVVIALSLVALFMKNYIRPIVFTIYPRYEGSAWDTGRISYLNVLKSVIIIILSRMYPNKELKESQNQFLIFLNYISLFFYVGMYWLPEISRIGFYFNAAPSILLLPKIIDGVRNAQNRKNLWMVIIIGSFFLFMLLIHGFYDKTTAILPYKTWLTSGY